MKKTPPLHRRSFRTRRLHDALVAAGHTKINLVWEPIGPALEMCGHSGGYIFTSAEQESPIPLGLSLKEALASVGRFGWLR